MKNVKESLTKIGHGYILEEDSVVVDRLKRIYMPESYRKAKLRSRLNQKTIKTETSPKESRRRHTVTNVDGVHRSPSNGKRSMKSSNVIRIIDGSRELIAALPEPSKKSRPLDTSFPSKQSPNESHHQLPLMEPPKRER